MRRLRFGPDPAAQAEAVFARQHHIEDEEVDTTVGHRPQHFVSVICCRHIAGVDTQVFRNQRTRLAVVFDDKNMRRVFGHTDACL